MKNILLVVLIALTSFCGCMPRKAPRVIDINQAMKAWELASRPGVAHEVLRPLEGRWETEETMWLAPGEEPKSSRGLAEYNWILGGRFLEENYRGGMGGKPFEGKGMLGYDNTEKKYLSLWADAMSTSIMLTYGDFIPERNQLTFSGSYKDPSTNDMHRVRMVMTLGDISHNFQMFEEGGPAGEYKSLEINYKKIDPTRVHREPVAAEPARNAAQKVKPQVKKAAPKKLKGKKKKK